MTDELTIRAVTAAHRELVTEAIKLVREHYRAISAEGWATRPDIVDDEGASLTIDGEVATLHFTASGWEADYASSFSFDAECLWSNAAIEEAEQRRAKRDAAEQAREVARQEALERAAYERMRRKFESTDLRGDLRKAMEITERIAAEDGKADPPAAD